MQQNPFIFYTATHTDPRDKGVVLRLGVERFIVKPLEPHLFLEVPEEVIAECRAPGYSPRDTLEAREETACFREYNEALVRRLETEVVELEGAYDAIEREMVDRKKAEEALRESEKRLAEIFNFLSDATFAIGQKGTIIAWNRTMEEMTGVGPGICSAGATTSMPCPFTEGDILLTGRYVRGGTAQNGRQYSLGFHARRRCRPFRTIIGAMGSRRNVNSEGQPAQEHHMKEGDRHRWIRRGHEGIRQES